MKTLSILAGGAFALALSACAESAPEPQNEDIAAAMPGSGVTSDGMGGAVGGAAPAQGAQSQPNTGLNSSTAGASEGTGGQSPPTLPTEGAAQGTAGQTPPPQ